MQSSLRLCHNFLSRHYYPWWHLVEVGVFALNKGPSPWTFYALAALNCGLFSVLTCTRADLARTYTVNDASASYLGRMRRTWRLLWRLLRGAATALFSLSDCRPTRYPPSPYVGSPKRVRIPLAGSYPPCGSYSPLWVLIPSVGSHIPILGSSSRLWVLHTPVGVPPDRIYVERRRCLNRMGSGGLMGGPTGIILLPGGSGKARLWFQAQVTPFGQALVDLISSAVLAAALCLLLVLPSTGQACSTVTCFSPSTGSGTHPCSFHSQTGYSPFGDGVFCLLNASNGFKMASLPIFLSSR